MADERRPKKPDASDPAVRELMVELGRLLLDAARAHPELLDAVVAVDEGRACWLADWPGAGQAAPAKSRASSRRRSPGIGT